MTAMLFLTSDEISELATPTEYVTAVHEDYRQCGKGAPAEPRTRLFNRGPPGMLTTYAAVPPETGTMGGYIYSAGFGAEDAWFMTPLLNAQSDEPLALLSGAGANPFKTGMAGDVAVNMLAHDDASALALIGSNAQTRGQPRTVAAIRDLDSVWAYSPTKESRESFMGEMDRTLDTSIAAVTSNAAAVGGTDIVVTATTATDPVFNGDLLDPGTHVTAMGQYHPEKRELDETTIERATYVPDLRERAAVDAGSFLAAVEADIVDEDHIHAELGEVVADVAAGREDGEEIAVLDSGGTDIETVATTHMLYKKTHEEELETAIGFLPANESLTGQ